jgi:3-oxoacyl-[acyl-carrier protein] reductase
LLARSKAELDLAQLEIEHAGGTAMRLRADVCDLDQMSTAVDRMRAHFGDIHVLICAAGSVGPLGPFVESDPRAWAEAIQTNLVGIMNACHLVLPEMIARRSGKIIAMTGGGAGRPRPGFTAYASAKAAVCRFIECLAEELRESNVQANCMGPGSSYTHMTDEILKAGDKVPSRDYENAMQTRLTGGTAVERQVDLARFLASVRSNHVSGKMIGVEDDWKRIEKSSLHPEIFTLRRIAKV